MAEQIQQLIEGMVDVSWVKRKVAVQRAGETAMSQGDNVHKALLRATCRMVSDECFEVRNAATEVVSRLTAKRGRVLGYLGALLPPSHGSVWAGRPSHILSVADVRVHEAVLLAIGEMKPAEDGEDIARQLVEAFLRMHSEAATRELWMEEGGGVVDVIRDTRAMPAAIVDWMTGAFKWVKFSEMKDAESILAFKTATNNSFRIIPNAKLFDLASSILSKMQDAQSVAMDETHSMIQRLKHGTTSAERAAAARWLGHKGEDKQVVDALMETLESPTADWATQCAAHQTLKNLRHFSLADALDPEMQRWWLKIDARIVCGTSEERRDALMHVAMDVTMRGNLDMMDLAGDLLADPNSQVRLRAAETLTSLTPCWEDAMAYVELSLRHPDPCVRSDCVTALKMVAMKHKSEVPREAICNVLALRMIEEMGDHVLFVRYKGLLLRKVMDEHKAVAAIVVHASGEELWKRDDKRDREEAQLLQDQQRLMQAHAMTYDEKVKEMTKLFACLPGLSGVLNLKGSGWNGGDKPDFQVLRKTLVERMERRREMREEHAWHDKRERLKHGIRDDIEKHHCTDVCKRLGLLDVHDEERKEAEAIQRVLELSDEPIERSIALMHKALAQSFATTPLLMRDMPQEASNHAQGMQQASAFPSSSSSSSSSPPPWNAYYFDQDFANKLTRVLGCHADTVRADMLQAFSQYRVYVDQTLKGAPSSKSKIKTCVVLPWKCWYLTEFDVDQVFPNLRVAASCAEALLSVACDGAISQVVAAVSKMSAPPLKLGEPAALLFTQAAEKLRHPMEVCRAITAVLVADMRRQDEIQADLWGQLGLDKPSRFLPQTVHVINAANRWLDVVWSWHEQGQEAQRLISVCVPQGEYTSESLCKALDKELAKVVLTKGWTISAKYTGRVKRTVVLSTEGEHVDNRCCIGLRLKTGPHSEFTVGEVLGFTIEDIKPVRVLESMQPMRSMGLLKDEWVGTSMGLMPLYKLVGPSLEVWRRPT